MVLYKFNELSVAPQVIFYWIIRDSGWSNSLTPPRMGGAMIFDTTSVGGATIWLHPPEIYIYVCMYVGYMTSLVYAYYRWDFWMRYPGSILLLFINSCTVCCYNFVTFHTGIVGSPDVGPL